MKMSSFVLSTMAFLGGILSSGFVFAHHGWAGYDEKKILNLKGKIVESKYANPHGTLKFESDGKTYSVVLAPTSRMQERGLTAEMLKAGTEVVVVAYPKISDSTELRAERITVAGQKVELR